jgi:hypothetical protein
MYRPQGREISVRADLRPGLWNEAVSLNTIGSIPYINIFCDTPIVVSASEGSSNMLKSINSQLEDTPT